MSDNILDIIKDMGRMSDEFKKDPEKAATFYANVMEAVGEDESRLGSQVYVYEKTKEDLIMELTYIKLYNERLSELMDYIGIDTIVGDFMNSLFSRYIEKVAEIFKDGLDEWIKYFIYECDCGKGAGIIDKKLIVCNERKYWIDTIESFADFYFKEIYNGP